MQYLSDFRAAFRFTCQIVLACLVISTSCRSEDSFVPADATTPVNVTIPADAQQPANEGKTKAPEQTPAKDEKAAVKSGTKSDSPKSPPKFARETDGLDIIALPLFETTGSASLLAANQTLQAAQIRMKLAATERGNVREFDLALESLKTVSDEITASGSPHAPAMLKAITDLKSEIQQQRQTAQTTFFGQFPLVRAFGIWPEDDEEFEVHSYTRQGEALRRAVHSALNQVAKSAATGPLHVLILVPGKTTEERQFGHLAKVVDAVAPEAFANVANIKLYPGVLRTTVDPMPAWNSPDPAFDPICRQFLKRIDPEKEPRSLMLVMVREFSDETGDGHWIQSQQRTYEASTLEKAVDKPASLEADKVKIFEAIAHDRSRFNSLLWVAFAICFLVALLTHRWLTHVSNLVPGDWQRWFAVPTGGFLIGFGLTPFIILAMKRWLPETQSDAMTAGWWPSVAGALSLVLPAGVFRLVAGAVGRSCPGMSCHGRWGIAFVPVALGVSAAWVGPTCNAVGMHCVYFVSMLAMAASAIVYCFGRAVDVADDFPIALTPITVFLSLVFGATAFMGAPTLLAGVIALAALTTAVHTLFVWRTTAETSPSTAKPFIPEMSAEIPRTLEQLRLALQSPKYQVPQSFQQSTATIFQSSEPRANWIGLVGPASVGKTAAARYLIDQIRAQYPDAQVLMGHCAEESPPYRPFREALAELGAAAGIIASNSQGGEVNTFFERLADEFIPFWDFISVDSDDEEGKEASRHDLHEGVVNALRQLTQRQGAVLFLDDVQWIDESSQALLKYLFEHFPRGSEYSLTIILAGREPELLDELSLDDALVSLAPATVAEQMQFLQHSFGIEQSTAIHLVKALGVMSQESGNLFWLIRSVGELIDADALIASPAGFKLRPAYMQQNQLPIPAAMRDKLIAAVRTSGQYLPVLECAALLGQKFRVDDLAQVLGMDRLLLLQILRHLEQELQLLRDVVADQDCYAFSSEFMLQIICEELGVGGKRFDGSRRISKIARELHARIAAVLERRTPRTAQLVCELAYHYHSAGHGFESKCVDFCLAAADTFRRQQAFTTARKYLTLAEGPARVTHRATELVEKQATIEKDEVKANLQNKQLPLAQRPSIDTRKQIGRPSYDT